MTITAVGAADPGRPHSPFGDPWEWLAQLAAGECPRPRILADHVAAQARFELGHHGPDLGDLPWLTLGGRRLGGREN